MEVDHPLSEPVTLPSREDGRPHNVENPPSNLCPDTNREASSKDKDMADIEDDIDPIAPVSPSHFSTSEGESEGENVVESQLEAFASQFEEYDKQRRLEIASQGSLKIIMTQAEEEALPGMPGKSKTKRKKERSQGPNRASMVLLKPPKTSKKSS